MDTKEIKGRKLTGTVVSDKMQKTAVVSVTRLKMHPKYRKQYKVTVKFKAHNPENQFKTGDKVVMRETRPMSREKNWIITEKIK